MIEQDRLFDVPTEGDASAPSISTDTCRAALTTKLKDPDFRKQQSFPIGSDEAILSLSSPPCMTACPNPFLDDWLAENAKPFDADSDSYKREPLSQDISEGKNDPIYTAHSYHTKVPHRAIMRYILHYTDPGDIVYDGFAGTGMTGVAAQLCADPDEIRALGFQVDETARTATSAVVKPSPCYNIGARKAVLNDLSPSASLISWCYNASSDERRSFLTAVERLFDDFDRELGWMYSTLHYNKSAPEATLLDFTERLRRSSVASYRETIAGIGRDVTDNKLPFSIAQINYIVWSDTLIDPHDGVEFTFWDVAVDHGTGRVKDTFVSPSSGAVLSKNDCQHAFSTYYDDIAKTTVRLPKWQPVLIDYVLGRKHFQKKPDAFDLALIEATNNLVTTHIPSHDLGVLDETHIRKRLDLLGITHVHHFFTRRTLLALEHFIKDGTIYSHALVQALAFRLVSRLSSYQFGRAGNKGRAGTLYISSVPVETNVLLRAQKKAKDISRGFVGSEGNALISTDSATQAKPHSVDFVFVDPPFGSNLMYSELNTICEVLHGVRTNNELEAIENRSQGKNLNEYELLIKESFRRFYEALKPKRWMVISFHNSSNGVWNAIQRAVIEVGFVITDVKVLNKKIPAILIAAGATTAVDKDLLITCYKPDQLIDQQIRSEGGSVDGVLRFLEDHLERLPVVSISAAGEIEVVGERTRTLLYNRMLAYHLSRGLRIPINSADFLELLEAEYVNRDGMYFTYSQVPRYDEAKIHGYVVEQPELFVSDERSAVEWLREQLAGASQTLGDLTPKFMQALADWKEHEIKPELADLLR